ncbi:MAG: (Fe-S)-binding protein, partial [Deferribacteres bacterium]|nr:(Fe-S)-binding protein [Deferribacteres bacterium]
TACPFCLTMFDDGIKNKGKEEEIQLKDIAEIVREAMEE